MEFLIQDRFPSVHLSEVVEIGARQDWQPRLLNFAEIIFSATDFPCVEEGREFFATIPQVERLFF